MMGTNSLPPLTSVLVHRALSDTLSCHVVVPWDMGTWVAPGHIVLHVDTSIGMAGPSIMIRAEHKDGWACGSDLEVPKWPLPGSDVGVPGWLGANQV